MKNNDCKQEIPLPDSSFRSAAWYQALSLTERLASLRSHGNTTPDVEIDTSLSLKRMRRWHLTASIHFRGLLYSASGNGRNERKGICLSPG